MNEWEECILGDVIEIVGGGTPKTTIQEYWNGDIPWLSVVDFNTDRKYVYGTEKNITQKGLENSSTKLLNEGDIIISARGTVGAIAVLKRSMAFNQSCYGIKGLADIVDQDFLFYSVKDSINNFQQMAHGGVFDTITRETFDHVKIYLPSFTEQRAIANVLSSLDDKIDLLHRQNKTIEGIVSTLWRKMFIEDADPGWKKGTLGDIADNIRVNVCVAELNNYEHYVGLEHIQKKHFALYDWGNTSELESNKSCFRNRDILFGKLRAYFHKVCFAPVDGVCSTDILVIRPKMLEFRTLCLLWFFSEDVVNYSDASSGGTRMPRTNWDTLASYEILIPPSESVARFNHHVLPMIDRIEHNIFSIRTLSRLRDTLLPKLMSGEVRVRL